MKLPDSIQHIKVFQSTTVYGRIEGSWSRDDKASAPSLEEQFDAWYLKAQPDVKFVSSPSVTRYGGEDSQISITAITVLYVPAYIDADNVGPVAQATESTDKVQPATNP